MQSFSFFFFSFFLEMQKWGGLSPTESYVISQFTPLGLSPLEQKCQKISERTGHERC